MQLRFALTPIAFAIALAATSLSAQPVRTVDLAGIQADLQVWGDNVPSSGYGLGSAVAAGDLNGDGIDDVIVGDPEQTVGALARAGRVYVFFGNPLRPRQTIDLKTSAADLVLEGQTSGARFGRSLGVGDLNGDGKTDLVVGQPFLSRTGISDAGAVYIFHGRTTWSTLLTTTSADVTVLGGKFGRLGMAVAAGDVNGDGVDDLLAGASEVTAATTRTRVGEAYAIFMSKTFPANHVIDLKTVTPNVTLTGRDYADRLGLSVASGDPNGDGIDDLLAGSPMARPDTRANAGEVYAIWGRKSWAAGYTVDLGVTTGPQPDLLVKGGVLYDRLSWTIRCDDLNGDGIDDILTGAHRADPGSPKRIEAGKAYVFFGSKSFPANHVIDLSTTAADVTFFGESKNDRCGFGCAIGDFDFDGHQDVLLTAPRGLLKQGTIVVIPSRPGRAYALRGPFSGATTIDLAVTPAWAQIEGAAPDDYLGNGAWNLADEFNAAIAVGDFNGDGVDDVLLGASRFSPDATRTNAGGAFVVYGGHTFWLDVPRVGTTCRIAIRAPGYPGTYRFGAASFGGYPGIPVDTRRVPLAPDVMFFFSLQTPSIFQDYQGFLDASGAATAKVAIPNIPALAGVTIFTAFVLLDAKAPSGMAASGNRLPITIQP